VAGFIRRWKTNLSEDKWLKLPQLGMETMSAELRSWHFDSASTTVTAF